MIHRLAVLAGLLAIAAPAAAAPPPKLIIAIAVDQFSADLFNEYRPRFTGGLRRLAAGAVFAQGYQSHAATETCPGHSTILTGARPARSGVIANNWYDLSLTRADKKVYCAEDVAAPGSSSTNYRVSPAYLKADTLGDRMKRADPRSRVVAVAGKDRAAVMMGGHATDQLWYFEDEGFATLADRRADPPAAVRAVNARTAAIVARAATTALPRQCRAHVATTALPGRDPVGIPIARKAGDWQGFRAQPDFDAATADLAIGLLRELKLGQGPAPDLLAIGLSGTDYTGHRYGTAGGEMCAQMLALDAMIGRILAAADTARISYVVVLTADHGGLDLPERQRVQGRADAARVAPTLGPNAIGKALAAEFGLVGETLLGDGPFGDWYVTPAVPAALRERFIAAAKARLIADPQVAGVFTATELGRMPMPQPPVADWSLADRFRASFDPERSGDLLVALKPEVTPIGDPVRYVATHGSPWDYDRRVPILFQGPGLPGFEQPMPVETVDILPTLAALIGLPVPSDEIDGRCLDLDPGPATTCTAPPSVSAR